MCAAGGNKRLLLERIEDDFEALARELAFVLNSLSAEQMNGETARRLLRVKAMAERGAALARKNLPPA